ncbi:PH domain-containing protein [Levilactobacillus bambusae]|uniref:YdbS-like PH domain-containing protein n=1 Tax=Levilactobacillus bambusae TaxID=2024736 RepID=A0A2V1N1G3_9LACO|nr:PH domain-containing protein [Levilactobacillus bambusae]PWG00225.1 hypothetical protein DCM90_04635 [Levilactobacillus bambusae]
MPEEQVPHRLSPVALLSFIQDQVTNWTIPIIFGLISLIPLTVQHLIPAWLAWVIAIAVGIVLLLGPLEKYFSLWYLFKRDALMINTGLILQDVTDISYDRITGFSTRQPWYMRPFHTVILTLTIESQTDEDDNFTLPGIPEAQLGAVVKRLAIKSPVTTRSKSINQPTYLIHPMELWRYAMTSPSFLFILAIIALVTSRLSHPVRAWMMTFLSRYMGTIGTTLALLMSLGIFLVVYVVATLTMVSRYYGFRLEKRETMMITTRGFFRRKSVQIPLDQIVAIRVKRPLIRRIRHMASVQLIVADQTRQRTHTVLIMPVISGLELPLFLTNFFPEIPFQRVKQIPVDRQTLGCNVRNVVIAGMLVMIPLVMLNGLWGLLSAILFAFLVPSAILRGRHTNVQLLNDRLIVTQTTRWLTTEQEFYPKANIHQLETIHTAFSNRQMADLVIYLETSGRPVRRIFRYLPKPTVDDVRRWYEE